MEDSMDIDLAVNHERTTNNNVSTSFATGALVVDRERPRLKDLKSVLINMGLKKDDADVLVHHSIQFIPLKLKTHIRNQACKDCGIMHGSICQERRKTSWQRSLPKTGWQACFRSWVSTDQIFSEVVLADELKEMRGWRIELDRTQWNLESMTRRAVILEPYLLLVSTRSTDYSKQNRGRSQPVLVPRDGQQDLSTAPVSTTPTHIVPVWSSIDASQSTPNLQPNTSDLSREEARRMQRQMRIQLLEKKKKLHQERMLRRKMLKAIQEQLHQANEIKYLQLHNRLGPPTATMTSDQVREKFGRKRHVLVGEIERLERHESEAMIELFAGVNVGDR